MSQEIKQKIEYLIKLINNPLADQNNIIRLQKELEWVNTANWTQQDWQLFNQLSK